MRLGFKIPRKPSQIYSALGLNDVPLVGSAKLFRQLYLGISLSLFSKLEYSNFIRSHLRENYLPFISCQNTLKLQKEMNSLVFE